MSKAYFGNRPTNKMMWGARNVLALAMGDNVFWTQPTVDGYQLQSISLSDGAYFDTGYYPIPNGTDIECGFTINSTALTKGVLGARTSPGGSNSFNIFYNVIGDGELRLDILGNALQRTDTLTNIPVAFEYLSQDNKCIVNGTEYVGTVTRPSSILMYSYYIGTFNSAGTPQSAADQTVNDYHNIYEWVDGVRVAKRLYVPWLRTSDNVACLRDTLTGEFIDAVTGTVTAGEPVEDDIELQWLELNDGGYFDTTFYPNEVTSYVDATFSVNVDQPFKDSKYKITGLFGTRNINYCYFNCFYHPSSTGVTLRPDFLIATIAASVNIGEKEEFIHLRSEVLSADEHKLYADDVLVQTATNTETDQSTGTALIFSFRNGASSNWGSTCGKIANWTYGDYVDGVAVPSVQYVPVIRGGDHVVCLKDTLTGDYSEPIGGVAIAGEPYC